MVPGPTPLLAPGWAVARQVAARNSRRAVERASPALIQQPVGPVHHKLLATPGPAGPVRTHVDPTNRWMKSWPRSG